MDPKRLSELDAILNDAAKERYAREAPWKLRRRIESRVRYVALQNAERKRFFNAASMGAFGLAGLAALTILVLWQFNLPGAFAAQMPGFWGHVDRAAAILPAGWWHYAGAGLSAVGALALFIVVFGRRRTADHGHSR